MKTLKITLLTLSIILFSNCKKEAVIDYKYSEKPVLFECENSNNKLLNEAFYSFESDLIAFFLKNTQTTDADRAHRMFLQQTISPTAPVIDKIVSEHTVSLFKILKEEKGLWVDNDQYTRLGSNSTLVTCISEKISNVQAKTTFNALNTAGSLDPRLVAKAILDGSGNLVKDKYLMGHVCFGFYYSRMFDIDLTTLVFEETKVGLLPNTPENVLQKKDREELILKNKKEVDPHAGHNH